MTDTIQDRLRRTTPARDAAFGVVGQMPVNPDGPEAADHIDAQDAKIKALMEVAHRVPERWAWGDGPTYRHRVCKDCGGVGEYDSWDSPLPHKPNCNYAIAQAALAAAKEAT